uniref:Uncharacterized protein n=1 Tax=Arundo donax TaxID=35708 RepID=A0A0A8YCA6_ARUDO
MFSMRSISASEVGCFMQNSRKLVSIVPVSLAHSFSHHSLKSIASL